jgi:hypothetical protein
VWRWRAPGFPPCSCPGWRLCCKIPPILATLIELNQSNLFSKSINQPTNAPLSIQNREVLLQLRQGIPVESQLVYDVLDKSKMLTVNIYLYNKKRNGDNQYAGHLRQMSLNTVDYTRLPLSRFKQLKIVFIIIVYVSFITLLFTPLAVFRIRWICNSELPVRIHRIFC